ncbi:hypothetical protein [Actinacidiphila rubida]|uniref:Uncharacterized protein n=1 Tax=Actinacidiphila rubida TaxID=310780 RepID=A0A1H8L7T5_9ACTN|nr:hypothetical protein [Actinacidiphila rubida]SEO01244.1 hypothetical protein SAMN05216267_101586 [Actinacidiphila rubida]
MSEYSVAISNLMGDNPARNVESIKRAVIANFRSSDEAVRIESTEYFNHTYAPDLVLRWDGSEEERQVFLRTNTNPQYLREDVEVISERQPILMPLAPLRDRTHAFELERESANARTLVADPDSLTTLSADRRDRPVVGLLSRAVLQGGKGVVDQERARSTSYTVELGFAGAQRAEVDKTRDAVQAAESLLDPSHADQLTRLLHAVWLGSGASPASFPGATDVRADLDAAGLQLLLEIARTDDNEFWSRIGRGVTLGRLCELNVPASSENLQRLLNLNLDWFRAKSCLVSDTALTHEYGSEPRWFTQAGLLGFTTDRYQTFFSTGPISSLPSLEHEEIEEVDLAELLDRADAAGVRISELVIESAAGGQIEYTAPQYSSLGREEILGDLRGALGRRSSVKSVAIAVGGGSRHIWCDLIKRAASGRTTATFHLSEFMASALPMLTFLRRSEYAQITRLTEPLDLPPLTLRWTEGDADAEE